MFFWPARFNAANRRFEERYRAKIDYCAVDSAVTR